MSDRLQELSVFIRVAEAGSFSRTARELGFSQSSVSRIIVGLETRLGVTLLLRTTRRVVLTEAGSLFLQRARELLDALEEAEDAARGVDSLRGVLRIAMPATFGAGEVIPRLPPFLAAHPQLQLELLPSDEMQDLVADGADLAIRFGRLPDSNFGFRKLADAPRVAVAAPAYLSARGIPAVPADLLGHDCLFGPGISARRNWRFEGAEEGLPGRLRSLIQVASADGVIAAARAGLGIAVGSYWLCRADLESAALVTVLEAHPLERSELYAVYPAGRRPSLKVRAFVDYLAESFALTLASHKKTSGLI